MIIKRVGKAYSVKLIALALIVLFLMAGNIYSYSPSKACLRVPIDQEKLKERISKSDADLVRALKNSIRTEGGIYSRIITLAERPETVKVESKGKYFFPYATHPIATMLYAVGHTKNIVSADQSFRLLNNLIKNKPFHDIKDIKLFDLLVFTNERDMLSHAAIYVGKGKVFHKESPQTIIYGYRKLKNVLGLHGKKNVRVYSYVHLINDSLDIRSLGGFSRNPSRKCP